MISSTERIGIKEGEGNILYDRVFNYTDHAFSDRPHFTCIYGSVPSHMRNNNSDLDMFVAAEYINNPEKASLGKFIAGIHVAENLVIDDEVPYENKLAIPFVDLQDAIMLQGLTLEEDTIVIPPIEKTSEFLSSREVRLRLMFNALTVPHVVSTSDTTLYEQMRTVAEINMQLLAVELCKVRGMKVTIDNMLEVLLHGEQGEEGEMYLGYKANEYVIRHLRSIMERDEEVMNDDSTVEYLLNQLKSSLR